MYQVNEMPLPAQSIWNIISQVIGFGHQFSSVQFSHSVMSDSLQPCGHTEFSIHIYNCLCWYSLVYCINWHSYFYCTSVQSFSHVQLFVIPWTAAHQASLSISSTPRACSNSCPSSQWWHPTISSPPPALNLSQHQGLFQWVNSSYQVAKILELQLQHQCF